MQTEIQLENKRLSTHNTTHKTQHLSAQRQCHHPLHPLYHPSALSLSVVEEPVICFITRVKFIQNLLTRRWHKERTKSPQLAKGCDAKCFSIWVCVWVLFSALPLSLDNFDPFCEVFLAVWCYYYICLLPICRLPDCQTNCQLWVHKSATIRCATPSATWQFNCTPVNPKYDRFYSFDRNFILIVKRYIYPNSFTRLADFYLKITKYFTIIAFWQQ